MIRRRRSRVSEGFLALIAALAPMSLAGGKPAAARRPIVAVYLPDYRLADFRIEHANGATDLIVFSAEPAKDGTLDLSRLKAAPWDRLRAFRQEGRNRLILSVGAWGRSAAFAAVASDPKKRARFVASAFETCRTLGIDGIDIDWEHPANAEEADAYAGLLAALGDELRPKGLLVSVTLAAWQPMRKRAFDGVDRVQIMAYDHDGRHATPQDAEEDVAKVVDRGAPKEKILLGIPFYGRGIRDRKVTQTYAEIVARQHPAPDVDEVGDVYFNGPATVRKKTRYAIDHGLGGVMAWEIGQDTRDDTSLLGAIVGEAGR